MKSFLLGVVGFFLLAPFGLGALGWFIGSTLGSLLSLQDTNTESTGPRVTDFRALNSKYGIPINKGYGTSRMNGNLIWATAVREVATSEKTCVKSSGFFGIGATKQCQTVTTFQYYQSFAVAFAEGPAADILRIWADGKVIYDNRDGSGIVQVVSYDPNQSDNPFTNVTWQNVPIRKYLGTSTQLPDTVIAADVGEANCPAYRNLVYVVFSDLDLEQFGFRIPTMTAEIAFSVNAPKTTELPTYQTTLPLDPLSLGHGDNVVEDCPELYMFVADGGGGGGGYLEHEGIIMFNIATNEELYRLPSAAGGFFGGGAEYVRIRQVSPRSTVLSSGFGSNGNDQVVIEYDIYTGEPVNYSEIGTLADQIGVVYGHVFDYIRYGFWATTRFGGMIFWPLLDPDVEYYLDEFGVAPEIETWVPQLNAWVPQQTRLRRFKGATISSGNVVSAPAIDKRGNAFWVVNQSGGNTWLCAVDGRTFTEYQFGPLLQTDNATSVSDGQGLCYVEAGDYLVIHQISGDYLYQVDLPLNSNGRVIWANVCNANGLNTRVDSQRTMDATSAFGNAEQAVFNMFRLYEGRYTYYLASWPDFIKYDFLNYTYEVIDASAWTWSGTTPVYGRYLPQIEGWLTGSSTVAVEVGLARPSELNESLESVVVDLLTRNVSDLRPKIFASDIDASELAADAVRGYWITSQQTRRNAIIALQQAYAFDMIESDGKIKALKRGQQTPVATIPQSEMAAHDFGSDPDAALEWKRLYETALPAEVLVAYADKTIDYQQGSQRARRINTETDSLNSMSLGAMVFTADEAAQIADVLLTSAWTERDTMKFAVGPKYQRIDPGDIVTLAMNNGESHNVRITQTDRGINGIILMEAVREYAPAYNSNATGINVNLPISFQNFQGCVKPFTIEIPILFPGTAFGGSSDMYVYAGAQTYSPGYGGGTNVYYNDGNGFVYGATIDQALTWGITYGSLYQPEPPPAENQVGETMEVYVIQGTLSSKTLEEVFEGENHIVFENGEVAAFTGATKSNDTGRWTLTGVIRGIRGTEHLTTHQWNTRWALIDFDALERISVPTSSVGDITTFSYDGKLETIAVQGLALRPFAPLMDPATLSTNDIIINWTRRDRLDGFWQDEVDAGMSEQLEQYEIDIVDPDGPDLGTVLRTTVVNDAQTWTYTSAMQTTDFGGNRTTPFYVRVYQMSATVGRGYPCRVAVQTPGRGLKEWTDWSGETLSQQPANTTERINTGNVTWITTDGSGQNSVGDKYVKATLTTNNELSCLELGDAGHHRNIEVLVRLRIPSVGTGTTVQAGVLLRGSGTSDADVKGILMGIADDAANGAAQIRILWGDGSVYTIGESARTYNYNAWLYLRARVYEDTMYLKFWDAVFETEPADWDLEIGTPMQDRIEAGFLGLAVNDNTDAEFDYISWAHNGAQA